MHAEIPTSHREDQNTVLQIYGRPIFFSLIGRPIVKPKTPRQGTIVGKGRSYLQLFLRTSNFSITSKLFYTHKLLTFPLYHSNFNQTSIFVMN